MNNKTKAAFKAHLSEWSTFTDWIRLNPAGEAVIGFDVPLQSPADMLWFGEDGLTAWNAVRNSPTGMEASWYQHRSPWRADLAKVEALYQLRMQSIEGALHKQFPGWATWPQAIQVAVMDLAWEIGPNFTKWVQFALALKDEDWAKAALNCPDVYGTVKRWLSRKKLLESII